MFIVGLFFLGLFVVEVKDSDPAEDDGDCRHCCCEDSDVEHDFFSVHG